jgi:hypothetical protein
VQLIKLAHGCPEQGHVRTFWAFKITRSAILLAVFRGGVNPLGVGYDFAFGVSSIFPSAPLCCFFQNIPKMIHPISRVSI